MISDSLFPHLVVLPWCFVPPYPTPKPLPESTMRLFLPRRTAVQGEVWSR